MRRGFADIRSWPIRTELALVAVPVWKGKPLYQSYLIAAATRKRRRLRDLAGTVHAFSDPDSNSGYLVTPRCARRDGNIADQISSASFSIPMATAMWSAPCRQALPRAEASTATSTRCCAEAEPELMARTRIIRKSELLGFPPIDVRAADTDAPVIVATASGTRRTCPATRDGQARARHAAPRRIQRRKAGAVRRHRRQDEAGARSGRVTHVTAYPSPRVCR